ncbi:MAG TPA: hypothetical protein VEZ11_10830 [Thermoanaerobaculia bacterium]|nr:hypothetical protein [Thermoanaerobaculia bacterium]
MRPLPRKSLTVAALLLATITCCGATPARKVKALRLRDTIPPSRVLAPIEVRVEIETEQEDVSKGVTAAATFINRGPTGVEVTNPELSSFLSLTAPDGTLLDAPPLIEKLGEFHDTPTWKPKVPLTVTLEPGKPLRVLMVVSEVFEPGSGHIRNQENADGTITTVVGPPSAEEIAASKFKWPPRRIPLTPGTYDVSVSIGLWVPVDTTPYTARSLDSDTVKVKLGGSNQ